ncbi:MAG TPA: M20/M25/M40 family metallo-hydrolase [Rhizomicrobium sp.]|nr:M20/M25/M40 family metallo-hydrolase [Rhizomicrobium sp.]
MRMIMVAALAAALAVPSSAGDMQSAAALRDRALNDPTAWNTLEQLTEIGPRMIGTPQYLRARDWGIAKLKALGFAKVHAEAFAKPSWHRGEEWAEISAPFPQKLAIIGLGGTPSTPPQGIEAPIVVLKSYAELLAAKPGAFKGKIVVVDQPMTRTMDGSGYGAAVEARNGDGEAARRGAVAYLIRSVSTGTSRSPHTGAIWGKDVGKIPSAALGVPDADQLERMAAKGPVRVRLKLASWNDPKSVAWDISGEVTGSARPNEIVVIGGHLDSWDPGTGAIDDAAGVAITTAAASLVNRLPRHPARTIRVVMFGSEETGGSSDAYLAAHKSELRNMVIASESDLGSDRAYEVKVPDAKAPALAPLAAVLAPLRIFVSEDPPAHAGSDVSGLQKAGVPVFSIGQDASRYFDIHHSADDTLAVVDRATLDQNVAAWASLLYLIADSNADFRAKPADR